MSITSAMHPKRECNLPRTVKKNKIWCLVNASIVLTLTPAEKKERRSRCEYFRWLWARKEDLIRSKNADLRAKGRARNIPFAERMKRSKLTRYYLIVAWAHFLKPRTLTLFAFLAGIQPSPRCNLFELEEEEKNQTPFNRTASPTTIHFQFTTFFSILPSKLW